MELTGKRVAVLAENMYQELELWYPLLRLREAALKRSSLAPAAPIPIPASMVPGAGGRRRRPDPGRRRRCRRDPGWLCPDLMRRYPAMVNLVRDTFEQGKSSRPSATRAGC